MVTYNLKRAHVGEHEHYHGAHDGRTALDLQVKYTCSVLDPLQQQQKIGNEHQDQAQRATGHNNQAV